MNVEIKTSGSMPGVPYYSPSEIASVVPSNAARVADLELELSQMRDRWMRSEAEMRL